MTESFSQWFRADDDGLRSGLVRSGIATAVGATLTLVTGLSFRLHFEESTRIACAVAGCVALLFGLVTGFVTLPRLLLSDHYIGLGEKELHLSLGGVEEALAWDDIVRIYERDGALVIERRSAEARTIARRFGGKSPAELAAVLERARLRLALGIRGHA